jgi:hypothetical protein
MVWVTVASGADESGLPTTDEEPETSEHTTRRIVR